MSERWLKALGMGERERQLRDDWRNERDGLFLEALTFKLRPGMAKGDDVVVYASGKRVVFAVGRVTSHPYMDDADESEWRWRVDMELDEERSCEFLREGEPLEALNVEDRDLRNVIKRRSHIRLTEAEFEAAREALSS